MGATDENEAPVQIEMPKWEVRLSADAFAVDNSACRDSSA